MYKLNRAVHLRKNLTPPVLCILTTDVVHPIYTFIGTYFIFSPLTAVDVVSILL